MTRFDDTASTPRGSWEERVGAAARQLNYPPTPNIAQSVRARLDGAKPARRVAVGGWARAALIALVILGGLMAVPGVRAAVLEFIRVGAVRIFLAPPTATPTPDGETGGQIPVTATPLARSPQTATPYAQPSEPPEPTFSLADLDGLSTLDDARAAAGFPVLLPTYPPDLGAPDRVYLQHFGGNVVIMVWLDSKQPDQVRMSLHALGDGSYAFKMGPRTLTELEVNGQYAIWAEGPYPLIYQGDVAVRRMVEGHVLIWTVGDVTYRLETGLSMDEAVKIAESLK